MSGDGLGAESVLVIEERAWGLSEDDARELAFPVLRRTWHATARESGLTPASGEEPTTIDVLGEPPLLSIRAAGRVLQRQEL